MKLIKNNSLYPRPAPSLSKYYTNLYANGNIILIIILEIYLEFNTTLCGEGAEYFVFRFGGDVAGANVEKKVRRNEIWASYKHVAFSVNEAEFDGMVERLKRLRVEILPERERDERDKWSVYFVDKDGHKFEVHTGTLEDRLAYYREDKGHMEF